MKHFFLVTSGGVLGREYQLGWEYESQNNEIIFKWPKEHFNDVKSLQGCEKWILRKILHRYSDSKIFSTFFFGRKKYFLKMKNIFLKMLKNVVIENFPKGNFEKLKSLKEFSFSEKYFSFSENYFFRLKKKVEKIFESLYRCKIFWRIHFSHPFCRLSSVRCSKLTLKLKSWFSALNLPLDHLVTIGEIHRKVSFSK